MDKAQLVEIAFVGEDANTVTASMRIPVLSLTTNIG